MCFPSARIFETTIDWPRLCSRHCTESLLCIVWSHNSPFQWRLLTKLSSGKCREPPKAPGLVGDSVGARTQVLQHQSLHPQPSGCVVRHPLCHAIRCGCPWLDGPAHSTPFNLTVVGIMRKSFLFPLPLCSALRSFKKLFASHYVSLRHRAYWSMHYSDYLLTYLFLQSNCKFFQAISVCS